MQVVSVDVDFGNHEILLADGSGRTKRINLPNFVKISQSVVKILRCLDLFVANLDHPRRVLVVSITVQNLVAIDELVSTKNAWQSLANSPLGATMSPPSK